MPTKTHAQKHHCMQNQHLIHRNLLKNIDSVCFRRRDGFWACIPPSEFVDAQLWTRREEFFRSVAAWAPAIFAMEEGVREFAMAVRGQAAGSLLRTSHVRFKAASPWGSPALQLLSCGGSLIHRRSMLRARLQNLLRNLAFIRVRQRAPESFSVECLVSWFSCRACRYCELSRRSWL
jgi:hypothetical protein